MAGRREVLGTWDDVFASVEPAHGLLAQEARDLILRLHPASVMTARPGDRAVTFGFGPRKMTGPFPSPIRPFWRTSIVGQSVACVTSTAMPTFGRMR